MTWNNNWVPAKEDENCQTRYRIIFRLEQGTVIGVPLWLDIIIVGNIGPQKDSSRPI